MKKKRPRHKHYTGGEARDVGKLSERLAPLEEHDARVAHKHPASQNDDTIVVDTGKLRLPAAVLAEEREKRGIFGLEPVIIVIVLVMLAFVAFIAYLVYLMPGPVK